MLSDVNANKNVGVFVCEKLSTCGFISPCLPAAIFAAIFVSHVKVAAAVVAHIWITAEQQKLRGQVTANELPIINFVLHYLLYDVCVCTSNRHSQGFMHVTYTVESGYETCRRYLISMWPWKVSHEYNK